LSLPYLNPQRTFYAHAAYDNKIYYAGGKPYSSPPTNIVSILDSIQTGISEVNIQQFIIDIHPNPFKTTLQLNYELKQASKVNIAIYNNIGEIIEVLIDNYQQQGTQHITFDAEKLKPGVYFCMLKTRDGVQTTKIIKL